jgi:uncharacterized protein
MSDAPGNTDQTQRELEASRAECDALRKERDVARADRDSARADAVEAVKRADAMKAERDAALKKAADEESARKLAEVKVTERCELFDIARTVLGSGADLKGKTAREIRVAAIAQIDSSFNADNESDEYIRARFDVACAQAR